MNINKPFVQIAAILAAISIAMGAIGDHVVKARVSPYALEVFQTAVRYQFIHVTAFALVGIVYYHANRILIKLAAVLFIAGVALFCGSLYWFIYDMSQNNMNSMSGHFAPVGGICLMAAWLVLAISLWGKSKPQLP